MLLPHLPRFVLLPLVVIAAGQLGLDWPCSAWGQTSTAGLTVERDLACGKGGEQDLKLDLARPEKLAGPTPVVVVIHGGAWRGGKKDEPGMTELMLRYARQGYVSASIQYRLCPQHHFPAQLEDVKCAIRFLRAHAEKYQIDPQHVGAIGLSAGAHLAMMLGAMGPQDGFEGTGGWADQSSQVQAVVSVAGPTQLDADDIPTISLPLVRDFIGGSAKDKPQEYKQASPVSYVSAGDAPMLLLQGTKDPLVPHTQAYRMTDALTKAGVTGRIELYLGAGHGWGGKDLEHTMRVADEFFARHLRPEAK